MALAALALIQPVCADDGGERIMRFDAEILVNSDSSIEVTENIRFNVRNWQIHHGINRDLPIAHAHGSPVRIPLELREVRLDGVLEDYEVTYDVGMVHIRIGSADRYISEGEHVYTIRYHLKRQIGRFADHDELYWNVNGNGWTFPIDKVTALVILPGIKDSRDIKLEAYTGAFGSKGADYTAEVTAFNRAYFETTRPFSTYENMSIVASFPIGTVVADNKTQTALWWFLDNGFWLCGLLLLGMVIIWYSIHWFRVGRDPREGLILREETPLIGLSPAQLRYIWKMRADSGLLSTVMLQLAQKDWLLIEETAKDKYEISRTDKKDGELLAEERIFLDNIFRSGKTRLEIDDANYSVIGAALTAIGAELKRELHHVYFELNSSLIARGVWLCIIGFLIYLFLGLSGLFLPNYVALTALGILLIVLMVVFGILIPSYTPLGRAVLDRIEGFRLAMRGGEDSLGEYIHADAVMAERYLAYANALDVNQQWGEQFSRAMQSRGQTISSPRWYHSRTGNNYVYGDGFSYSRFSESMPQSFSRSVSHSATPPSSSGSGGGGSSGGGGGGGGGSGW
jgi:hypothetical protein